MGHTIWEGALCARSPVPADCQASAVLSATAVVTLAVGTLWFLFLRTAVDVITGS